MKKKILLILLTVITAVSFSAAFVSAAGSPEPQPLGWLENGRLVFKDQGATGVSLVSKEEYSGSYIVEFSYYTESGGYGGTFDAADFYLTLGHKDPLVAGGAVVTNTDSLTIAIRAAGMNVNTSLFGIGGNTFNVANGLGAGQYAAGGKEILFKFYVNGGVVTMFYDWADTPDALSVSKGRITLNDGTAADVLNGHIVLTPNQPSGESSAASVRKISYFKTTVSGVSETDYFVNLDNWTVLGDASKARVSGNTDFEISRGSKTNTVATYYAFTSAGIAGGDTVLEINAELSPKLDNADGDWGILFGMPQKSSLKTDNGVYYLEITKGAYVTLYKGDGTACVEQAKSVSAGVYLYNNSLTFKILLKKNGDLTVKAKCSNNSSVWYDGFTEIISLTDVSADGYAAFTANLGAQAAGKYVEFKGISFLGNVRGEVMSITLDKSELTTARAGDEITLSAEVVSKPAGATYTYSIVSGGEFAQIIDNSKIKILSEGVITLRVTADTDALKYDEVTFTAYGQVDLEEYDYTESFEQIDRSHWTLIDGDSNSKVSGGAFVITDDFITDSGKEVRLVNNTKFIADKSEEVVFDVTFTGQFPSGLIRGDNLAKYSYGLLFGMSGQDDRAMSGGTGFLRISNNKTEVYLGADKIAPIFKGDIQTENTQIYLEEPYPVTVRAVALNNGTLKLYRAYEREGIASESIEDLFAEYSGFDFNGYIALTTYCDALDSPLASPYTVTVKDFSVKGSVLYEVIGVTMGKTGFYNLVKGKGVQLSALVKNTCPTVLEEVEFSITEGAGRGAISAQGVFTASDTGFFTVRAASVSDSSKYDEVRFEVKALEFTEYSVRESFKSLNEGHWTLFDDDGDSNFDDGLYINKDFKTDAGGSVRVVSNLEFGAGADTDVVFDIEFKSSLTEVGKYRNPAYSWGLLFGMKNKNDNPGDNGVGYFRVDYNNTAVFFGGERLSPEYKGSIQKENFDIYGEIPYYFTVRLVALSDGTLQVYRAYEYWTASESITQLFAEYKGLDFGGFIAFTTDSYEPQGQEDTNYTVHIKDVAIDGMVVVPDDYEVLEVSIDQTPLMDAITSTVPVVLKAEVTVKPNLDRFKKYNFSVVSGGASIDADGNLVISEAGQIVIRATAASDNTKYKDYTFSAIDLVIENIIVTESAFQGLNSDSQPIDLVAILNCNSVAIKHQSVEWSVIKGDVEIVHKQLRILGAGEVTVRVTSVYRPESYRDITFTVADADAGKSVYTPGSGGGSSCGSSSSSAGILLGLTAGLFISLSIFKFR